MGMAKFRIVVVGFFLLAACALNARAEDAQKPSKELKGAAAEIGCAYCQWNKVTGAKKCAVAAKIGDKVIFSRAML